ncbi:pyridoxamine 5'-phosphate oxidase family protein [Cytophagaceae bacterium ABcell3]|nr:pyridoxamine 5'-phosphate oxidase family protein [Cytophagaceae bacterium ABcell3]
MKRQLNRELLGFVVYIGGKRNRDMEKHEKLKGLVKDIKIAMLTTIDNDGMLRSRPMSLSKMEDEGVMWFFTQANAPKTEEIEHDGHVNINFMDRDSETYISVSGHAATIKDQNKIEELWSPVLKAWFPKGKEDENIALIRVEVDKAEYWDAPSGKLKQAIGMAKAAVTGQQYEAGENKKIDY